MKSFKQYLSEGYKETIYHGDNFGISKLQPRLMNNGNNQVGIGIYFGALAVAKTYGKNIISIEINPRDFKDANIDIDRVISDKEALNILKYINKNDRDFWYMLTDYGMEVQDHSDVEDYHLEELYEMLRTSEARNFQIEVTENTSVELFVKAWNMFTKIHGLYEDSSGFYSVINTKYKVNKL